MNDDVNIFTIIWLRMSISVYDSNTNESLQFVTASSFNLGNGRLHRFRLRFSYFVVWYFVRLSTNVVHLRFLHCFADFFTLRQLQLRLWWTASHTLQLRLEFAIPHDSCSVLPLRHTAFVVYCQYFRRLWRILDFVASCSSYSSIRDELSFVIFKSHWSLWLSRWTPSSKLFVNFVDSSIYRFGCAVWSIIIRRLCLTQ